MSVLPRLTRQAFRDGPHRRFAVTVAHRIGPIENIADALSHAARRLRLLEPDPDQHVPNHRPRDAVHLHIADMGKGIRSEEHTSELQSLMRISYAVFCLKKNKNNKQNIL